MDEGMKARDRLFDEQKQCLEEIAYATLKEGFVPGEFVLLLFDVNDLFGRILAAMFLPGPDWQKLCDQGKDPVAIGVFKTKEIIQFVSRIVSADMAKELEKDLPPGAIRAIVLGSDGASVYFSVYFIEPAFEVQGKSANA